jgi:hypothetical protein
VEADLDRPGLGCLGWAVWNGREMVVFAVHSMNASSGAGFDRSRSRRTIPQSPVSPASHDANQNVPSLRMTH